VPDGAFTESDLRTGIESRLKADSQLMALLATPTASVFHRVAPQTARLPLIVYEKRSGQRTFFFGGPPLHYEMWGVRGVAHARTADRAEAIGARIEDLMVDLTVAAHTVLDVRLESDIDFPEKIGKETIQHNGGVYRIVVE
jgi:hypothetical protein